MDRKFGILKLTNDRSGFVLLTTENEYHPIVSFEQIAHWYNRENVSTEVVTFTVVPDGEPGKRLPLNILRATEDNDPEVLRQCFFTDHPVIWRRVAARYLAQLDASGQVQAIAKKLNKHNKANFHFDALIALLSEDVMNSVDIEPLRNYIYDLSRKNAPLISDSCSDRMLANLSIRTHHVDTDFESIFGPSEDELIYSKNYPDFRQISEPDLKYAAFKVSTIENRLTDKDRDLARIWAGSKDSSKIDASAYVKMLSARMAEKAAALFFHNLGFPVKDIAIQQIDGGDDWRTHDLRVRGKAIDVKNARKPYHGNTSYVEHLIPRFKHDRNLEEVDIFGVLSPYLQLSYSEPGKLDLQDDNYINKNWRPTLKLIQILGITTESYIKELEANFKTSLLVGIEIEHSIFSNGLQKKTIPAWVFEFPTKYYSQRNQSLDIIRRLSPDQIPPLTLLTSIDEKPPIAAFIAAGRRPPSDWLANLQPWKVQFIEQLLTIKHLRLPEVFLSVLRHFIESVHNRPSQYDPLDYLEILRWGEYPLGCRDPLNSIAALCINLSKVWIHREFIRLHEFDKFYFKGLGILQGSRANSNDLITLIAYCGGYTEKLVKCGYPDLILGNEGIKECPDCHHLICPKCGYCWSGCNLCSLRQDKLRGITAKSNTNYSIQNNNDSKHASGFVSNDNEDIPF